MCPPTGIAHFVSGGLLAAFYVRDLVLTADGWVPTSPEIVAQDRAYLFTSATAFGNLVRTSLDSAATLGDSWRYLSPTVRPHPSQNGGGSLECFHRSEQQCVRCRLWHNRPNC